MPTVNLTAIKRMAPQCAAPAALLLSALLIGAALPVGLAGGAPPSLQQGAKLTGGEESGEGRFGRAVALSADGDTALVGGPRNSGEAGAVWVFTRSGAAWTEQAKLTGGGELGEGRFGRSVALSADGNTALVGATNDGHIGAAWVFTRSGAAWTQQAKLTGDGESGSGWFGQSVALSADGGTALVGGFVDHSDVGAAWVFTRSGTVWKQQGVKLTGGGESGEGEFGWSVALSADGGTALIGGWRDGGGVGAAWVFTRSGAASDPVWTQQGEKLTGGGEGGAGEFGQGVALSADGTTALIGGRGDGGGVGAAWVFTRSGGASNPVWTQQGEKLTGGGEGGAGEFGQSVALSADGATALAGGREDGDDVGAAWVFTRSDAASDPVWTQQGEKLTGGGESGAGEFGWSVALSSSGETALIGGLGDGGKAGAAWVFVGLPPAPEGQSTTETASAPPAPPTISTPLPAPAAAKQGVEAFKAAAGRVVLLGSTVSVRRNGRAAVRLRCVAAVACRGTLTLAVRGRGARGRSKPIVAATARFSIAPGAASTVPLALSVAGRSRLRAARGRLRANLAVRVSAPEPAGTRTWAVKLVSRKTRRAHAPGRRFGRAAALRHADGLL
jgi:FG-GAP repeat